MTGSRQNSRSVRKLYSRYLGDQYSKFRARVKSARGKSRSKIIIF